MASRTAIVKWLLDSDPSIRWQVTRDLTDAACAARAGLVWKLSVQRVRDDTLRVERPAQSGKSFPGVFVSVQAA